MKRLLLLTALAVACYAQTDSLACGPATVGSNQTCTVALASGGNPTVEQFQVNVSIPASPVIVTAGTQTVSAMKSVSCNPTNLCIIWGVNNNIIVDGNIANISIPIPATATGNITVSITNGKGSTVAATTVINTSNPLQVSVPILSAINRCDLNGDGHVDATDVGLIRTAFLATTQAISTNDMNRDNALDVSDVQIVINAALGQPCTAKP